MAFSSFNFSLVCNLRFTAIAMIAFGAFPDRSKLRQTKATPTAGNSKTFWTDSLANPA
jgi:hypothetical protein